MTMQGVGFTDELLPSTMTDIAQQARSALAEVPPCKVKFGEVIVADEAITLPAQPPEPIQVLRATVRDAIGEVLGPNHVPEDPNKFRPHLTVAYVTTDGPAQPYIAAVRSVHAKPVSVQINDVNLIEMHRDNHMYEWTVVAPLPLIGNARG
jgi:2'-5' RNA ligase